ncbi:AsmA-like C-terminal region-containing protein [Microbaculum marinisediminis]|uniref:AsmA family protein n=1 Tax=Microbaculum marinisediminis TaxID=2931392 RepID=UPI0021BF153D|nr:AsmA-like C-terminal region-containing protein [Microbaculum sp. A6E488]
MNSFLLSLGIAVALILIAAFGAPFFIDWSSYRTYFETRATEMIGRPVVFEGDLNVRIVPFPSLTADGVRIGGPGSGEGIERIDVRAGLTPLLSGELDITDLILERPRAVLRIDGAGRIAWGEAGDLMTPPVDPDRVAIKRFEIVEGEFAVEDARSGETQMLTGVNLSGSATSLLGPVKVEGGGVLNGERYTVRVATGRVTEDGSGMRIKASILPAARPMAVELDGALLRIEDVLAFDGRLIMERPAPDPDTATWRMDGRLTASAEQLVLEDLSVRLGTETQNVSLAGAANVRLGADPRFDAVISARQVDLDRAFGAGPDSPVSPSQAIARLGALLDPDIFPLPGHLALDVESTVLSGGLLEGLSIDLEVDAATWSLERATVSAPGRTSLGLAGTIGFGGEAPVFDGAARLSTDQATVFANWVFGPQARLPGFAIPAGDLDASGQLRIDGAGMMFDRAEVRTGDSRIEGSIGYRAPTSGSRGAVALSLTADELDLSKRGARPLRDEITVAGAVEALLSGVDLELELGVGNLAVDTIQARDVLVSGRVSEGDMRFDRLEIGDIGGARLAGGGEIRSYAKAPDGTLGLEVSAGSLTGVVAALRALDLPALADALDERAQSLVPAAVTVDLSATRTETGSRGTLTLAGTLDGSRLDGSFGYDGAIDDLGAAAITVAVDAANPDGAGLARQIGLIATEAGAVPGRISLAAKGRPRDAVTFTLETAGIGIDGTAEGSARWPRAGGKEITAEIGIGIANAEAMLALAGIAVPPDGGTALRVDGTLSVTDDIWRMSGLTIGHGGDPVTGALTVDLGGAERIVGGRLETARIDLAWLLGALVGADAVQFPDAAYGDPAWPSMALIPARKPGWRGRIELHTPEFTLFDDLALKGAETIFSFDARRVSLETLRGDLVGGRLVAGFDLTEADGVAVLSGRAELADGRLEEIVWKERGRAVATGAVSAGVEFDGRGRSLAAIVASLSGTGSFKVTDGALRRFNPNAFDQIVSAADAGLDLTEDRVRQTFAAHLDSGSLPFETLEGAFSITSGILRASTIRIDAEALTSFASATVDLPVLGLDSEWTLRTDAEEEGGRSREVGVVFAGPIDAPTRQIDVSPLLGYLTVRAFEQEVERLETLQSEILERQKLGRELIRQGEERARRARESQERARQEQDRQERDRQERERQKREREEEEAKRRAAEEAAAEDARRQAEEAARRRAREQAQPPASPQAPPPVRPPSPLPQMESQGGPVGIEDTSELQRRIEEILREVPSERDGDLPVGGAIAREPVAPPAPAPGTTTPAPGTPAPPLGEPLVISPQPGRPQAAPSQIGPTQIVPPQTIIRETPEPLVENPVEPDDRVFR